LEYLFLKKKRSKYVRVLANIPKNIKILFWGEFNYYSPLMFE
jgi:hypothetical protein